MIRHRSTVIVAALSVLVLAGCAAPGPEPAPSASPSATGTPTSSPTSSPTAAPTAAPTSAPTASAGSGDCTAADAVTTATTYTVLADDSTTPVTITYTAFTTDGGTPLRTATVYGPVSSTTVYACVPAVSGGLWTFTATGTTSGALGCVLGFGGRIVARDSAYNEGALVPETVDCTGNPGR